MAAMPADSPSMLSSRLKALVMPTTQISASSPSMAGMPVRLADGIRNTTTPATIVCTTSFVAGRKPTMSSSVPSPNIKPVPSSNGSSGCSGAETAAASTKAPTMAQPPSSGTGSRCQRSPCGFATTPTRRARARQSGVRAADSARLPSRVKSSATSTNHHAWSSNRRTLDESSAYRGYHWSGDSERQKRVNGAHDRGASRAPSNVTHGPLVY